MHAQRIIQDLLSTECPFMHAKRRACLAANVEAASKGALSLMGISRALGNTTTIRIASSDVTGCWETEKWTASGIWSTHPWRDGSRRVMSGIAQPLIIVDWSDLRPDRSLQLLRASLVLQGRALTLYEEVHPISAPPRFGCIGLS